MSRRGLSAPQLGVVLEVVAGSGHVAEVAGFGNATVAPVRFRSRGDPWSLSPCLTPTRPRLETTVDGEPTKSGQFSPEPATTVLDVIHRRVDASDQKTVAAELGVTGPAISQYLAGKHQPSIATIQRLAIVEGVGVERLLVGARDRAADICREAGVPESAIEMVLAMPDRPGKPALYWIDAIRLAAALERGEVAEPGRREEAKSGEIAVIRPVPRKVSSP